ncbi:exophilin-5 isoform X1 [Alligator sinensis]|uniref:Exophilin-5 isoform X1 n=3 Tax=Alligator sinensis TaxID=38654 RepID=A0A3Q0HD25_ALLSI|nr:exophilin-5 isoform X1 [Alligator sinensis]XP_025069884.1 exophilin-5 isoform X1 [Alligator sinensis]XP_025069885.1 exophilin-5 isoform X1 [Alligator sinensis]
MEEKTLQNDTEGVSRMLKQPIGHQLKKTSRNNPNDLKMPSPPNPQPQKNEKNTSSSILGFRSPFAWLFSFRKSRKHTGKHQTQEQPQYDSFAQGAHTASEVEEMAKAEAQQFSLPEESIGNLSDGIQTDMMEESSPAWNEQLEEELFRVLDDLDNQLAQEQVQDPVNRRTPVNVESNAQCSKPLPATSRQTHIRGRHRNDCSGTANLFFLDGMRTVRAKDEHNIFCRTRRWHDTFINRQHTASTEDFMHSDSFDLNSPVLNRRLSSPSFGQSSEGSLHLPSITRSSGFVHQGYIDKDTVGRSYSLCSLMRRPSFGSSDQFSANSLQHPLVMGNSGFVRRNSRQNPKRIPLSSIEWNKPYFSEHPVNQDRLFKTQSLIECNSTQHGMYPCPPQESRKYELSHSKHHYRSALSSTNWFSRMSCPDKASAPSYFENWENYPFCCSENNLPGYHYRDITCHGSLQMHRDSAPCGRRERHSSWSDIHQYYNEDAFLSPEADFDIITTHFNLLQNAHAKNAAPSSPFVSQHHQSNFQTRSMNNIELLKGANAKVLPEFTRDLKPCFTYNPAISLSDIKTDASRESFYLGFRDQTKPIKQNSDSVTEIYQNQPKPGVIPANIKKYFKKTASEKERSMELSGEANQENSKMTSLQPDSQQIDTNSTDSQFPPSHNSAAAALQNSTSLLNLPFAVRSRRKPHITARRRDIAKMYMSSNNKRNVQTKENDHPANSGFNHTPPLLSADENKKELFFLNQKKWEHNFHSSTKTKRIELESQRAETTDQTGPKRQSLLVADLQSNASVHSVPITGRLAEHQSKLSSAPQHSGLLKGFSSKSSSQCLETPTNSSLNCTVTEAPAEGGKVAQLSAVSLGKETLQEKSQDVNVVANEDQNKKITTSCPENRNSEHIYACCSDRPKITKHGLHSFCQKKENGKTRENNACAESLNKPEDLPRTTTNSGITGSPDKNKSTSSVPLVPYHTLPRKSASIAGSVISAKLVSNPKSEVPFKSELNMWDPLETSDRTDAFSPNQGGKISSLDSAQVSQTTSPFHAIANMKGHQTEDYPLPLTQQFNHPLHYSAAVSSSDELTGRAAGLNRRESSVFLESLDKETNSLQKYKTTSTFTVCVDEDNVKYHELVSVYYTLPCRHSRTLCNLFQDNPENTDLPLHLEKFQWPKMSKKKSEARIGLANVAFPSTLEKEEPSHSPAQIPPASVTPQNLKTAAGSAKLSSQLSPSPQEIGTLPSTSFVCNMKDISPEPSLKDSTLVLSDIVTTDVSLGDPQSIIADNSVQAISDVSCNQNTGPCLSSVNEKEELFQTGTQITSISSKPESIPENLFYPVSSVNNANSVQKEHSENFLQSLKVSGGDQNMLLPCSIDNSSREEKHNVEHIATEAPITPAESKSRYDAEVQGGADLPHSITSLHGNKGGGFPLTAYNSKNSTDENLISDKMLLDLLNKTFQLGTACPAKPILQPDKTGITAMNELESPTIKEKLFQHTQMDKDCTGLQRPVKHYEDNWSVDSKDKFFLISQDLQLPDNSVSEDKLPPDSTKDRLSDIEKRKNRPSVKNKLAAICKTSQKYSSKNLLPKPNKSNIFSQNEGDAAPIEIIMSKGTFISADSTLSFLQTGNENKNQNLTPSAVNVSMHKITESKRSQANEDLSLVTRNNSQKTLTESCRQRGEAGCPKQNKDKVESVLSPTTLFPEEIMVAKSKNLQASSSVFENRNKPVFSTSIAADSSDNQNRTDTNKSHHPPWLPFLPDANSNSFINNYLQANICPQQKMASPHKRSHKWNRHQSSSLKNVNLHSDQLRVSQAKNQRERHFSECTYTQDPQDSLASAGCPADFMPTDSRSSRKFKSYSELLSCDENENWASSNERNRAVGTRHFRYPSVEYGIFGKEQQLAFLENIKRSLTEGRLWRPCLLKNTSFVRDEESHSLNQSELLNLSFAGSKTLVDGSNPREPLGVYREDAMACSDSDTNTTTDDEYYLDENDKESEL